ncbi:hypothetical protein [Massilia sp. DD77]|uniref:hypothetical protein n=1 Tax=Massilia sp. DD77 TaxID=3109349 RepID=UPI002FFEE28C
MIVDDAAIVGPKNCQLESWAADTGFSREYWAVPACNLGGNLELAIGGARINAAGQRDVIGVLQGKTLLKPLNDNGWGIGLVFGSQTVLEKGGLGDLYTTVPVSFSFADSKVLLHMNAGLVRVKSSGRSIGTYGIGAEFGTTERSTFIIEAAGQEGDKPLFQLGVKYWLMRDHVQVDASYGKRMNTPGADRIITPGLVFFTNNR